MSRILVGTCSWADKELIDSGGFYPKTAKSAEDRLRYYATQFPIVEVDSSYYAPPAEQTAQLWAERTPPGFVFDVKAFRLFTQHPTQFKVLPRDVQDRFPGPEPKGNLYLKDIPPEHLDAIWDAFIAALRPLKQQGKLGVVLFQFPPWFHPLHENREHILRCRDRLEGYPIAVEFRAGSWMNEKNIERSLAFLEGEQIAFTCVDEPQGFGSSIPPFAYATAKTALVRFHGRNTETWEKRTKTSAERFDYMYRPDELEEWVPKVVELAKKAEDVHLLMNTNRAAQGPVNANQLKLSLEEAGLPVVEPPAPTGRCPFSES